MPPLLLGVDVGTTNCKAVVYTADGRPVGHGRAATPTRSLGPGRAEYDAEELWTVVAGTIRAALDDLAAAGHASADIVGLAVASMAEAGVLLGVGGRPLAPIIAWFDQRTLDEGRWWTEVYGARRVFDITGQTPQPIYSVCKLMWLHRHLPDAFARARVWLNVADWILYRLTGVQATDLSLASRMMTLDVRRQVWSAELLAAAEIPPHLMPPLAAAGRVLGAVTAQGASATGLAVGTPATTGGHDHIVGAFGVGVTEPGRLLNSMGTAEALVLPLREPLLTDDLFNQRGHVGVHVAPGRYYTTGGLAGQGAALEWARGLLVPDRAGATGYVALNSLAESAEPGSGGVVFVPHLRGAGRPHNDPTARGALVGLTPDTRRERVARSVFEGMAYGWLTLLESMEAATGVTAREMVVIGGGARNRAWLQIKADVAQRRLRVIDVDEATAWGAAALAGVAVGIYRDVADMTARTRFTARDVAPNPAHAALYEALYRQVYRPLYETLRGTNAAIRLLQA